MKGPLFSVLLFLAGLPLIAQEYPVIKTTSVLSDPLFKQQQKETESWYFNQARSLPAPPLVLYQYETQSDESLVQLAAVFNLPVDTLATINGFQSMYDFEPGSVILIPSNPGIYINMGLSSRWNQNLSKEFEEKQNYKELRLFIDQKKEDVRYYPGEYLPSSLRLRFVKPLFSPPLETLYITSHYGYRDHPFTGEWELHTGTDYRAPIGTPVRSCSNGKILSYGELEDYGKYIIIQHRNGYTSLYGHLNKIQVTKGQIVDEGEEIGVSGNTGLSTGPHLHFEIRKNGLPRNPEDLLNIGGE